MRLGRLFASLVVFIAAAPAYAACTVCDQVVTLNAKLAECYLAKYDEVAASLGNGSKLFTKVDLSSCGRPEDLEKDFTGLPTFGKTPRRLKLVYILDKPGIDCIKADLLARQTPIDPVAEIDLTRCSTP